MKKSACKKCKILSDGNECPICKGNLLTTNWQGRVNILDVSKSIIAKKINSPINGEYVIKIR